MAPITLLSSPPAHLTKEQFDIFQSSTPADGKLSHDPVLHYHQSNVTITLDPAIPGFEVDEQNSARGDVYVTEGAVSFFDPSSSTGFSITYPTISLHAISRQRISRSNTNIPDGDVPEQPCVYCQLDENEGAEYETMQEDEDEIEAKELSFFPDDQTAVQTIYAAMSKCATLYPSVDRESGQNGSTEPDWESLLAQANENANGNGAGGGGDDGEWEDAEEEDESRDQGSNGTGRTRPDFVTPSSRFNPY